MNVSDYDRYLVFFDRAVLSRYRASPDLYVLEEDDMGGELSTSAHLESGFRVRFGFRRLEDNRICVAALGWDVKALPKEERVMWSGHLIQAPVFAEDDPAYQRWVKRNLEGSWDVEDGPRVHIERLVRLISALTRQTLGTPLWRFEANPLINYPIAENTDAYAKAHLELYRLLIDGLDKDVLALVAQHLNVSLTQPDKTLNSLKELLPDDLIQKVHGPLRKCSEERKVHGVRPTTGFPAFDSFHGDLVDIGRGLATLNDWLQDVLSTDSEACLEREGAMAIFPEIVGPPRPEFKLAELEQARGKTIQSVEFGEVAAHPDTHESEGIVLHFTDGSSMCIHVASNAMNLCQDFKGLSPQDVHTNLMVFWAPAIARSA
ncbi:MAG: hypothetical protein WBF66_07405 [Dehalococcoidia bacterium]